MNISRANESDMNDTVMNNVGLCSEDHKLQLRAVDAVFLGICVFGLTGNIIVLWNLCFRIPWNKYTVYIANLSIVDSLLIAVVSLTLVAQISNLFGLYPHLRVACPFYNIVDTFYYSLVYSGKNILTAISVERCVSVLFPLWYHTRRPTKFSIIACTVLWFLGILEGLLDVFVCVPKAYIYQYTGCAVVEVSIFVSAVGISLPLMVISSVTLLLKVKRTTHQEHPPRLYIVIIITVIIFILSVLPLNIFRFLTFFKTIHSEPPIKLIFLTQYWLVFNSTVNPYIYFLVGRNWNQTICCSVRESLHRAFMVGSEEVHCSSQNPPAQ